ncbi:tRNA pseudouridine(13) synthase TruD [Desulfurobacterium atlanticum]|uniref:tRNA pseudouridine synthase D n=1 Tax=Desulfurobacterium atlanticum TaxID=240169 RepID=A0A238XQW1_9BACT|nr:tRNA pseudouridine(13) synthase TruD [Desulfurobacterium atlanticum]SNR61426.1 tRNA pseudouridine13 synthase [Desulfurobacterium atlanticum]
MKLYAHIKKYPEDFVVEEIPDIEVKSSGKFDVYKLEKRNVSTLESVRLISRFLKIPLKSIGFAGLKDKYAVTTQFITVPSGSLEDRFGFVHENGWRRTESFNKGKTCFFLEKVGKTDEPLSLGKIKGNRFTVKIRNFEKNMRERFYRNLQIVKLFGFANYFGEQRFGSVKSRDDFVLKYLLKGDFETALKVYFLGKEKISFITSWRDIYKTLKPALEEYEKDMIKGLLRGLSAEKAFRILPKNVRLMFNFAFQSFLWNEILALYIKERYPYVQIPFVNNWKLNFYLEVDDLNYLKNLEIPYTGKVYNVKDRLLKRIMEKVFRLRGVEKEFFDREVAGMKVLTDGIRKAVVFPEDFRIVSKTKKDVVLQFKLPPGSYATILLRKLLSV